MIQAFSHALLNSILLVTNYSKKCFESVELIEEHGDRFALNRELDNRFVLGDGYPINGVQDLLITV